MENIQNVTPSMVMQAYSGKIGCMCGCKGKYWVMPEHKDLVAKSNGYEPEDKELNPKQVTKILRLIQAEAENENFEMTEQGAFLQLHGKQLAVYFAK